MMIRSILAVFIFTGCSLASKPSATDVERNIAQANPMADLTGTWRSQGIRCASGLELKFDKTNYQRLAVERVLIITPQFVVRESNLEMKLKTASVQRGLKETRAKLAILKKQVQDTQVSDEISKLQSQELILKDLGHGKRCTNSETTTYEFTGDKITMKEFSRQKMGCPYASPISGNHIFSAQIKGSILETIELVDDAEDVCPKTDKLVTTYIRH